MNRITNITCLLLLMFSSVMAQEKKVKQFNTKKWYRSFGIGNSSYRYIDLPKGRNEINYRGIGGEVDQSKGGGLILDAKIQYKFRKNYLGVCVNYYKDRKNSSGNKDQTIDAINRNRLTSLTIYDNQSYLNIGINYERQLYYLLNGRVSLNASLGLGYSANLTPDRIEYDYYFQDCVSPAGDTLSDYRHTSTGFRDGFFINPSLNIKINSSTNHGMIVEISWLHQWHKTSNYYIDRKGSYGGPNYPVNYEQKYRVSGIQLKFNYFF